MARGQRGEQRRQEIARILKSAPERVLGLDLAKRFGISRQILVQDVAILRAEGLTIIATPQGYFLRKDRPSMHQDVIQVQHDRDAIFDELSTLADLGITVVDVAIDHSIYGPMRGDLLIASRQDAREYLETLERTGSLPLLELVGDHRHSHTVAAPRPELLEKARAELRQRGYLIA